MAINLLQRAVKILIEVWVLVVGSYGGKISQCLCQSDEDRKHPPTCVREDWWFLECVLHKLCFLAGSVCWYDYLQVEEDRLEKASMPSGELGGFMMAIRHQSLNQSSKFLTSIYRSSLLAVILGYATETAPGCFLTFRLCHLHTTLFRWPVRNEFLG